MNKFIYYPTIVVLEGKQKAEVLTKLFYIVNHGDFCDTIHQHTSVIYVFIKNGNKL